EDFMRSSSILTGDTLSGVPGYCSTCDIMPLKRYDDDSSLKDGFRFASGDPNVITNVRKKDISGSSGNKYVINSSFQANTNMMYPIDQQKKNVAITLFGQKVQFETRRQGSAYYYDNSNPGSPVFYQLDGWH